MKTIQAIYIDGHWLESSAPRHTVINAASGEAMASLAVATAEHVKLAVAAAKQALPQWAAVSPAERGRILDRIADGLAARAAELAATITGEVGMPLRLCERIQVGAPLTAWRNYAELAGQPRAEKVIGNSTIIEEPVGVVAAITPWNYPLHQVTAKVAAALAAGATVVLKPSEIAPLSAIILAEVIQEAGLPAGVYNLVTGLGPEVGAALVEHPDVAMVSFTGSTVTGSQIAAQAARQMKRISLELGGKSPSVVLEGADLATAVKATLGSCLLNSGQTCNALTRLIVPDNRFDETAALLRELLPKYSVGDPTDAATRVGPLASREQQQKVRGFVASAIAEGVPIIAKTELTADLAEGFFAAPIIFGPVAADHPLVQEEIFGPVLTVQTHGGEADAVRLANGTRYGLAAAVWAADEETAARVARNIRAGQVDLNGAPFNLAAPFGGYGWSGLGRENGEFGLHEFLEVKALQYQVPGKH